MRIALALVFGLGAAGFLAAQQPAPSKEGQERDPIVVTASRLPEEEADKAGAVTGFTGAELQAAQVGRAVDLGSVVPGLQTVSPERRSNIFGMRGLANGSLGEVPVVGLYLDDIPYTDWRACELDLYDVESVMVHRGPQPTLFGKMAEAGAISVRTRPASDTFAGDAGFRFGNYGLFRGAGAVRGPLAEKRAYFSISGIYDRRDGFLDNAMGGEDDRESLSGRAKVELLPFDDLSVMVVTEGQRARDGADPYSLLHQEDMYEVDYNLDPRQTYESYLGAARVAYQTPWFEALSVTARRRLAMGGGEADFDFSPLDQVILIEGRSAISWSQELRLDTKDRFKEWRGRLGAYYEAKDTDSEVSYQIDDQAVLDGLYFPFPAPPVPVRNRQMGRTWGRTLAVYGEGTTTLMEQFDFTLGARYESYRAKVHKRHLLDIYSFGMTQELAAVGDRRTDDVFLPRAAVAYRPTGDLTAYALFSGGYRPAGYSQISDDPNMIGWDPERIRNFEVGLKSTWLEGALQANVSLFYQDLRDCQVRRLVGPTAVTNVNAEEAWSRGVEIEVWGRPVGGVELGGSIGFIQAKFEDFTDPLGAVFDDNRLPLVPPYDYSIYGQYSKGGYSARIEWDGVGKYYYDELNEQRQPAYGLLHARVGYGEDRWGVYFFGWNLLDREYRPYAAPGGFMTTDYIGYVGTPRQIGAEVVFKF